MSKKQPGMIRIKAEYENTPILDTKTKKFKDLDEIFNNIKDKLR